jgi:hypothetical protein
MNFFSMNDIATSESLLASLNAYIKHFEIPNTRENLLAISSSIVTFQQKQGNIAIAPDEVENLIQTTVDQFNSKAASSFVVDSNVETLVEQVNQWQQSLDNQVLNTLNAYVQNFLPNQTPNLPEMILSIVPFVENVQLHKVAAQSLIQRVTSKFDLQTALSQIVAPEPLAIAQQISNLLQFGGVEELLQKNLLGDQQLLNHTIGNVTESLVNDELSKIIGNNMLQLDIDVDSQQLLVKHLRFADF